MNTPPTSKVDPIRTTYFKPLERAERGFRYSFYAAGMLSLIVLLIDKSLYPQAYGALQVVFAACTLFSMALGLLIRLYFTPRALSARLADFTSSAFSVSLTSERTAGYYNNWESAPIRKIGAQNLENAYFTKELLGLMCRGMRKVLTVLLLLWVVIIFYRGTPIDWVLAVTLVLFGEELLSRALRLECFRGRAETVYEATYRLFQAKPADLAAFGSQVVEQLVAYECAKASSGITIPESLFERQNSRLSAEWERIRSTLTE